MEQRINEKINNYMTTFKTNIQKKVKDLNIDLSKNRQLCELMQFIMDYENVNIESDDFKVKKNSKKRIQNVICDFDRCCAKKINDEQCSRKKKINSDYCGSHSKSTPYGIITEKPDNLENNNNKIQISIEDIQGIIYYIDKNGNVYHPQDIINNVFNPRIISKYVKNENNVFTLV